MVFDSLDNALRSEWVLHDGVLVPGGLLDGGTCNCLWFASKSLRFWESEGDFVPDFCFFLGMGTLLHSFSYILSLID